VTKAAGARPASRDVVAPGARSRGLPVPLAILVDFDGTICLSDAADEILAREAVRPGKEELDRAYVDGSMGSRENLAACVALLPADPAPVLATADQLDLDPTFAPFVARARDLGAALEVVSDGFGFYVGRGLARIGLADLPVATAETSWPEGGPILDFPFGHPTCLVCGTCKRERVLAYQARGFHVAFIGDGLSDRYAAAHADTIIAKDRLVGVCGAAGIPYVPWRTFHDVTAWLDGVVAGRTGLGPPRRRPFICGPEAWGPEPRTAAPPER
jgi:2-hydroxy-3-keto-5-methylthiopentenyl-1-phosphate phosphatase